jgi:hypothetical protein
LTTRLLSGGRAGCGDGGSSSGAGSASVSGSGSGVRRGGETSSNSSSSSSSKSSPLPRGLISLKMRRRRFSRVRGRAMGERLRVAAWTAHRSAFGIIHRSFFLSSPFAHTFFHMKLNRFQWNFCMIFVKVTVFQKSYSLYPKYLLV